MGGNRCFFCLVRIILLGGNANCKALLVVIPFILFYFIRISIFTPKNFGFILWRVDSGWWMVSGVGGWLFWFYNFIIIIWCIVKVCIFIHLIMHMYIGIYIYIYLCRLKFLGVNFFLNEVGDSPLGSLRKEELWW